MIRRCGASRLPRDRGDPLGSQTERGCASAPLGCELIRGHAVILAAPGLDRCALPRRSSVDPPRLHLRVNLCLAPRERADRGRGYALDLRDPVPDLAPPHAEPRAQLAPEHGLVDEARGARLRVDGAPVQRTPGPVGDAGRVRDQDVRVDLRVPGATGPMLERRADEALPRHDLVPARTSARTARVPLEVAQRLADGGPLRVKDGLLEVGATNAEEDRSALGHREHEVEARNARPLDRTLERLPRTRIALGQHGAQRVLRHLAPQRQTARGAATPLAGRLRASQVVILCA